ncbi:MAG: hypothetical protein Q7K65_00035 [Candidatus Buchananbacteria bacterium]|nr:hypothetical protein [Candidatus Buchananbacteria bacterium]
MNKILKDKLIKIASSVDTKLIKERIRINEKSDRKNNISLLNLINIINN